LPAVKVVAAIFLILISVAPPAYSAEAIAGSVKTAQGGVVVRRGAQTIPVSEGMHLLVNDTLQTSADGRVGAILQDGTRIGLGPDTELRIDTMIYEPADQKFGLLLRLARGVMAYFSGGIARLAPGAVKIETPVGVIGLRGTHMAITLEGT
jgi:hypothetical protein